MPFATLLLPLTAISCPGLPPTLKAPWLSPTVVDRPAALGAVARALPSQALAEVMGELGREWLPASQDVAGWAAALTQMIELPEAERRNLGERSRAVAKMFAPEANVRAVQSLYDELLS